MGKIIYTVVVEFEDKVVDDNEINENDHTNNIDDQLQFRRGGGDDGDGIQQWLQTNVLQGVALTPTTYSIMVVYFVQGALGLAALARTYFLKDQLGLAPAEWSTTSQMADIRPNGRSQFDARFIENAPGRARGGRSMAWQPVGTVDAGKTIVAR